MNRRNFLSAMLTAGMAPAIVKAANLMPVRQPSGLWVLETESQDGYGLNLIRRPRCIFVDGYAGDDAHSGLSWEQAMGTFSAAMVVTGRGDRIYIRNTNFAVAPN